MLASAIAGCYVRRGEGVRRTGSVSFKLTAPGVEVTETTLPGVLFGAVIGQHCSVGPLPPINLRRKGNALVFP